MKNIIPVMLLSALAFKADAQEIATCKEPQGFAHYSYKGIIKKESTGWDKDGISGGMFSLKRISNDEWDILFLDSTKSIRSSKQEGAVIKLIRTGEKDMTFLVYYPGATLEVYTFMQEKDGKNSMHLLVSKGGDAAPISKSSVLIASCGPIQFLK